MKKQFVESKLYVALLTVINNYKCCVWKSNFFLDT